MGAIVLHSAPTFIIRRVFIYFLFYSVCILKALGNYYDLVNCDAFNVALVFNPLLHFVQPEDV